MFFSTKISFVGLLNFQLPLKDPEKGVISKSVTPESFMEKSFVHIICKNSLVVKKNVYYALVKNIEHFRWVLAIIMPFISVQWYFWGFFIIFISDNYHRGKLFRKYFCIFDRSQITTVNYYLIMDNKLNYLN